MRWKIVLPVMILFTVVVADPVVDRTLEAPAGDITGLGFGEGYLWAVDRLSETVFKLDPVSGSVIDSWLITEAGTRVPSGLTFGNGCVYVAAGYGASLTTSYCYRYTSSGSYMDNFSLDC